MPRCSGIASWKRCAPSDGYPLRFAAMPKQRRPPRRAPTFQHNLRPITFADGTRLKTLKDDADFFAQYSTVHDVGSAGLGGL